MTKSEHIFVKLATTFGATRNLLRTLESKGIPLLRTHPTNDIMPQFAKPAGKTFSSMFGATKAQTAGSIPALRPGGAGAIIIPKSKESIDMVKSISPSITPRQLLFHEAGHALNPKAPGKTRLTRIMTTGRKLLSDMGEHRPIMSINNARQSGLLSTKFGKTKILSPLQKTQMSTEHSKKVSILAQQHMNAQTLQSEMGANRQARTMMPASEHAAYNVAMKPAYQTYKDDYHRIGQTIKQHNLQKLNTRLNTLPKAIKPNPRAPLHANPAAIRDQSNISIG